MNGKNFLSKIDIVELNRKIKNKAIEFRKEYKLKIPDAIICASAFVENAVLITNDKKLVNFKKHANIDIFSI